MFDLGIVLKKCDIDIVCICVILDWKLNMVNDAEQIDTPFMRFAFQVSGPHLSKVLICFLLFCTTKLYTYLKTESQDQYRTKRFRKIVEIHLHSPVKWWSNYILSWRILYSGGCFTPDGIHIPKESGTFEWKFHPKPFSHLSPNPATSQKAGQMLTPPLERLKTTPTG